VAVAPWLCAAYHPHFPDLAKYYDVRTFRGDDVMRQQYLPDTGGSFPSGVKAGAQERRESAGTAKAPTGVFAGEGLLRCSPDWTRTSNPSFYSRDCPDFR
jgi:hypothetical protein